MPLNKRNASEMRQGITDARRGVERPWDTSLQKQGPYWDAHQRTVRKIVDMHAPMYLREKKLALELELLDDRICDLIAGDFTNALYEDITPEKREEIQKYLSKWVNDFRDIREHYGLEY